jgi:hypothetical protein
VTQLPADSFPLESDGHKSALLILLSLTIVPFVHQENIRSALQNEPSLLAAVQNFDCIWNSKIFII